MDGRLQASGECGPSSLAMQAPHPPAAGPASYDGQGRLIWGSFTNFYQRWGPDISKGPSGPLESPNAERRSGGKRRRREGVVPMMRSRERESLSSRGAVGGGSRGREDNDRSTGRETPGDEVQGQDEDGNSIENMLGGGGDPSSGTASSSGNSSGAGSLEKGRHAKQQRSHTSTQPKENATGQGRPQDASPSNHESARQPKVVGRSSAGGHRLEETAKSQKLRDAGRKDQVWADMLLQELNDSAARAEQQGAGEEEGAGAEAGAPAGSFQFIKAAAETPFQRVSRFESLERAPSQGTARGGTGSLAEPRGR